MPPVRWKLVAVAAICLAHISTSAKKAREIPEDGWRPIVGHRDEITQYRNPSSLEAVKVQQRPSTSEPISPPQPPPPKPTANPAGNDVNSQHRAQAQHKVKVSPYAKHKPFHFAANQGHAPHIPMNLMTHRSQTKPYKLPVVGKTQGFLFNGKRPSKPVRVPVGAHSTRDEIFVAAPSTAIGNYAFFTQGQVPLTKPRLNQPQGHLNFGNRFVPNEDFFQFQRLPVQQYVLPKYQIPNDVHYTFQAQNDEYTRNLVPPVAPLPPKPIQEKEKQKAKEQPVTEQVQVTKQGMEQAQTSLVPENIIVQVPPPYQQQAYYVTNQNQNDQAVNVQVTKEKLNVFHNNIPTDFNRQNEFAVFGSYQFAQKPSEAPKMPTYEVTEGKVWQQTPVFQYQFSRGPERTRRPQIIQTQVEKGVQFLPTPVKPPGLLPTSATQSEISTIYTAVSNINKQKEQENPSLFNVKDVSTHYPILGQPVIKQQYNIEYTIPGGQESSEYSNEITTIKAEQQYAVSREEEEEDIETTKAPIPTTLPPRDWQQKRRPSHRRRRPTNRIPTSEEPYTSNDSYEAQRTPDIETTTPRERPLRRRPTRYRTTEATSVAEDRPTRTRYRQRPKPTEESVERVEIPHNHKATTDHYQKPIRGSYSSYEEQYERTTEEQSSENRYNKFGKYDESDSAEKYQNPKLRRTRPYASNEYERPVKYRIRQQSEEEKTVAVSSEEQNYRIEEVMDEDEDQSEQELEKSTEESEEQTRTTRIRRPTTTVQVPTTSIHTPENEVDYSTVNPPRTNQQETITIEEVHTQEADEEETTTLAAVTTTATTTTTEPTTTKSNRLRRPVNYKSSPRPRFSVKEYRQRLNQYTSTTTESGKATTEASRIRYSNRSRRPIVRLQPEVKEVPEEENVEASRTKFVPKSPRYGSTSEPKEEEEVEKTVKATNSRARPYGRNRSTTTTTEATTTQKISIKPNIFSNLRRPPQISLRNRILNRYSRNNTAEKTTKSPEPEHLENETSESVDSTENVDKERIDSTTGADKESTTTTATSTIAATTTASGEDDDFKAMEILKNDEFLQSQHVSDLTSSAQNDYNRPGMFKSVQPNVRRVPSYFTISTDDPILPIEAFFTNINKEKH